MNIEELRRNLVAKKIPADAFNLGDRVPTEEYCLDQDGSRWRVYFSERGSQNGLKIFEKEDEACEYFYEWITRDLKGILPK